MARLSASERAKLPDTAFAYVDSAGKRRLPINDESHVRNALSRFNQVRFESEEARDAARKRLLRASKRHGIVPVGFIDAELRSADRRSSAGRLVIELGRIETSAELERELRRTLEDPDLSIIRWSKPEGTYVGCRQQPVALPDADSGRVATFLQGRGRPLMALLHEPAALDSSEITEAIMAAVHLVAGRELLDGIDEMGQASDGLPDGEVTFLLTDIEGSTPLLQRLGDTYAEVLEDIRGINREAVLRAGGRQVEARADEYTAVFDCPAAAVEASVDAQRAMAERPWFDDAPVRIRAGVHTGHIMLTEAGYVGITVHAAARIMSAAHGGQILVSGTTRAALSGEADVSFRSLGRHQLRGLADDHELLQVVAPGLACDFPAPAV